MKLTDIILWNYFIKVIYLGFLIKYADKIWTNFQIPWSNRITGDLKPCMLFIEKDVVIFYVIFNFCTSYVKIRLILIYSLTYWYYTTTNSNISFLAYLYLYLMLFIYWFVELIWTLTYRTRQSTAAHRLYYVHRKFIH